MDRSKVKAHRGPAQPAEDSVDTYPTMGASESVLVFPCRFPIKAMGPAGAEFERLVVEIVLRHSATLTPEDVRSRLSRGGKWVSVTLTVEAESREQLDAIYRDLSSHQAVAWVI